MNAASPGRDRSRPRPLLRATIAGVGAAVAAGATRYDALTKPGGPGILWRPLLVSSVIVVVAALVGGIIVYWSAKKERQEYDKRQLEEARAEAEAENAREQRKLTDQNARSRAQILAAISTVADVQTRLVGAASAPTIREYVGRYKQLVVECIAEVGYALQTQGEVAIRAMLCDFDQRTGILTADGSQLIASRGSDMGQWPPSDLKFDGDHPLVEACQRFLVGLEEYHIGDSTATTSRDIQRLRSPDDPQYYVRVKLTSGDRILGMVFVDVWGSIFLSRAEIQPILTLARMLAAGLAATEQRLRRSR
jgi:hypothetical protein